ncbi:MAG: hypothetical protein IPL89_13015 [Acidobacteria bacterium]|nr:hypothetical protein [Acidobacteriota bacterium]
MTRRAVPEVLAVVLFAAAAATAQTPAFSGLSPTPTPPAATSGEGTPDPTPAPKLKGVAGPPTEAGRSGQSLADVVRVSKEARKDQKPKKSLGTITNETLHKGGSTTAVTAKGPSKTPAASAARKEPTPAPTYDVPRDDQGRSEAQWKATMDHARSLVQDGERRVRELETKSKQLENDFYAQSDGYRRDGVIKPAWDKSRDELAKARVDLDAARKSLEDLSDEARRSNASPGWLR